MTKLAQEHARVTALTDTQLLSIGCTGKAKQAYARLLWDTIDALASSASPAQSLSGGQTTDDNRELKSENDAGHDAPQRVAGSMGEPSPD